MVEAVADLAVGHVLHILQGWGVTAYVGKAVLESLVWEYEHVAGVCDLGPVYHERIGVYVRLLGAHGYRPYSSFAFLHGPGSLEHLAFEFHLRCVPGLEAEGHASVRMVFG